MLNPAQSMDDTFFVRKYNLPTTTGVANMDLNIPSGYTPIVYAIERTDGVWFAFCDTIKDVCYFYLSGGVLFCNMKTSDNAWKGANCVIQFAKIPT